MWNCHLPQTTDGQSEENLEPLWSEGLVLPDTVMDIVADQIMDTQEASQAHESENTFYGEGQNVIIQNQI